MSESLKNKTGKAFFWSFLDKGGQQVIQLIFWLILARMLSREEFGLIAVLTIFTAVASILQESGFSSALIRRKNVTQEEYSTVFYFNIGISILIYAVLFFVAPKIGSFYDQPVLKNLSRFIFMAFVFNSFGIIQNVNLMKRMDFKRNTIISLIAGVLAGIISIFLARKNFGVWSLAAQTVLIAFFRTSLLWAFVKWKPIKKFSVKFILEVFPFSVKILLTSLMNQICGNLYSNIIGKYFSMGQTGDYSQGNKLNSISQSIISDGVKNVAYPMLTQIEEEERRIRAFRKVVRITAFISLPIALFMLIGAKGIILVLLTDKWSGVIPILRLLAIGGGVYPLYNLVSTILQYEGKSGRFFLVELARNVLSIAAIFITIRFGVLGLVGGISLVNIIAFFIGYFVVERVVKYKLKSVLRDILPYLIVALISYTPFFFAEFLISNKYILLAVQLVGGSMIYLGLIKFFGSKVMDDCIALLKRKNIE